MGKSKELAELGDAVTVDGSNIGIGTSSPISPLHINVGTNQNLRVFAANSTPTIGSLNDANSAYAALGYTGSQHEFRIGTSEAMRIDNSGNVGIGTSSPRTTLSVEGAGVSGGQQGAYIVADFYDTSAGAIDVGGGIGFRGNDGVNSAVAFGTINGLKENATSGNYASYLNFKTRANAGSLTERMRIDSSGNVLVGKTTPALATAGTAIRGDNPGLVNSARAGTVLELNRLSTDGALQEFYKDGTTVGSVSVTSSGTTYNTTSDRRLKDNIEPIADGTAKLMAMKPVTHTWIADPEAAAVVGFIAQEMQEIVPEAVSGDPDGEEMMSMDYGRITPILVAALQEATNEIKALKERVSELEAR